MRVGLTGGRAERYGAPMLLLLACSRTPEAPVAAPSEAPAPVAEAAAPSPEAITTFWRWFTANEKGYRDLDTLGEPALTTMAAELSRIDTNLSGEIYADKDGTHVLVLTANGILSAFPAVQAAAAAAPALAGWRVEAFRAPSRDPGWAIKVGTNEVKAADVRVWWTAKGDKLDLDVWIPAPAGTSDTDLSQLGFLLLDHSLGEYAVETRIGHIAWHPMPAASNAKPLSALQELVVPPAK